MKVSFGCEFDSGIPERRLKRDVRALLRRKGVRHFLLIDQHTASVFPVPTAIRHLSGVARWEIPLIAKVCIYAVWIPLMPVLILLFSVQAIVSGKSIREEAKRHPRWALHLEQNFAPSEAIAITSEIARLTSGPAKISFAVAEEVERPEEFEGGEIEPTRKDMSLDEYMKLDSRDELNFRDVLYSVSP